MSAAARRECPDESVLPRALARSARRRNAAAADPAAASRECPGWQVLPREFARGARRGSATAAESKL